MRDLEFKYNLIKKIYSSHANIKNPIFNKPASLRKIFREVNQELLNFNSGSKFIMSMTKTKNIYSLNVSIKDLDVRVHFKISPFGSKKELNEFAKILLLLVEKEERIK